MSVQKKIVLVTTKQPSSNPRLVKEAIALASKGIDAGLLGSSKDPKNTTLLVFAAATRHIDAVVNNERR